MEYNPSTVHPRLGWDIFRLLSIMTVNDTRPITDTIPDYEQFSKLMTDWGDCLDDAVVNITINKEHNVILGMNQILGAGDCKIGSNLLSAIKSAKFEEYKWLAGKSRASRASHLLTWLIYLSYDVCRWTKNSIQDCLNHPKISHRFGCWQDAFGSPYCVLLTVPSESLQYLTFGHTSKIIMGSTITLSESEDIMQDMVPAQHLSKLIPDIKSTITCDFRNFVQSFGAVGFAVKDSILVLQGEFGYAIKIGSFFNSTTTLWHVLSFEEYNDLFSDFESLLAKVISTADNFHLKICNNIPHLDDLLIVGALIVPDICPSLSMSPESTKEYVARNFGSAWSGLEPNPSVFTAILPKVGSLIFQSLNFGAEFAFGAQGPQATVTLGGEVVRDNGMSAIETSNTLRQASNGVFLYLKQFSMVFVYERESGYVIEQNLYNILNLALNNTQSLHHSASQSIATFKNYKEWQKKHKVIRQYFALFSKSQTPTLLGGTIGGVDLYKFIKTFKTVRLAEKPPKLPSWSALLGRMPALAVNSLGSSSNRMNGSNVIPINSLRCTAYISIARLEEELERFMLSKEQTPNQAQVFVNKFNHKLILTGIDGYVLDLVHQNLSFAIDHKWKSGIVIIPGKRLTGQPTSGATFILPNNGYLQSYYDWFRPLKCPELEQPEGAERSLGIYINGQEWDHEFLGMLIECV